MSRAGARFLLSAACLLLLGAAVFLSRGGPALRARALAGNVSVVTGGGGNVAVLDGADGVLLVDAKLPGLGPELEALVARAGQRPAYVIDTHWHVDHVGGNPHFGPAARILAHANVLRRLEADPTIRGRLATPMPADGLPTITFDDASSLFFDGEEIRLIHVPRAHTDGDTVVWFTGSGVAHVGDLFVHGYPPVDLASGGSVPGLIRGLQRLVELLPEDVVILPGHGEPTDLATLRDYVAMLESITERVRAHPSRDVDGLLGAGVTTDFDGRWGHYRNVPPRRFLELVVGSLD